MIFSLLSLLFEQKIQGIVDEVELSLKTITALSTDAIELINTVPTDLEAICPLVNISDFKSTIGVDLTEIVETIISQQYNLEEEIASRISIKQSYMDGIQEQLSTVETFADEFENFFWILPGLLLTIIGLTVTSVAGVILAWKGKSGSRFQRSLSYGVLPLLILLAIACWVLVMLFAMSTMVGTDICLSGSFDGSPDQTIQEILSSVGNETEGTLYHFASTYIIDCEGNDPSKDINEVKMETQKYIDNIWRQVSKIDSVGRVIAIEKCGATGEFSEMLSGARDLAMILTDIRRYLSSLEEVTSCESIHSIYTEASEEIVCTETLSASSYGFITFLIIWVCVMAMISLRASWLRNNTEEGKVYHDENEVAENMVVDEHEEYLAYLSKYKNEWQEYEGFEEDPSPRSGFHSNQRPQISECSDHQYYYGNGEEEIVFSSSKSDVSTLDSRTYYSSDSGPQQGPPYCMECKPQQERPVIYQRKITTREIMDHHDDGVSYASGVISFDSLSSAIKSDVLNLDNILVLPPPMNPDFSTGEAQQQRVDDAVADQGNEYDSDFSADFGTNAILEDLQVNGNEVEVQLDLQVNGNEVEVQLYDL